MKCTVEDTSQETQLAEPVVDTGDSIGCTGKSTTDGQVLVSSHSIESSLQAAGTTPGMESITWLSWSMVWRSGSDSRTMPSANWSGRPSAQPTRHSFPSAAQNVTEIPVSHPPCQLAESIESLCRRSLTSPRRRCLLEWKLWKLVSPLSRKKRQTSPFEVVPLTSFSRNIVEHLLRGTTVSSHAHMFDSHRCSICYHAAVIVNL